MIGRSHAHSPSEVNLHMCSLLQKIFLEKPGLREVLVQQIISEKNSMGSLLFQYCLKLLSIYVAKRP